ncbi:uncharacterized protein LOC131860410 [Cryptomeria japonica]|uniref:uncharacterized protein LOC131860410 n=1 Tax=Cryptomeria japonica TaxID=3369 RepID=UPI0027D9E979|nr:uncharacterized protein LOC131860410 [Cryptomeria japonica]
MVFFEVFQDNQCWKVINVYGPIATPAKRELWQELSKKLRSDKDEKIIIGGDFNVTLNCSKKMGSSIVKNRIQQDFQEFVDSSYLREIVANNDKYTWTNRRQGFTCIAEKLDRFFPFSDWSMVPGLVESSILRFSGSDHFPIQLVFASDPYSGGSPFRFEKIWIRDPSLLDSLTQWWQECRIGNHSKMFIFPKNLSYIKAKLKEWIRVHFKNIFTEIQRIENELRALNDVVIAHGMRDEEFGLEQKLKAKQAKILAREEQFWRQKSGELCL